jgi:hypothetical protein
VTITRIVVLVVGIAALVAALPALRGNADSVQKQVSNWVESHGGTGTGQSGEQISSGEFAAAHAGMTPSALQNLVGSPADQNNVEVEGLKLDCWYYGVAGATGAYQFCFQDGKLSSKRRFASG